MKTGAITAGANQLCSNRVPRVLLFARYIVHTATLEMLMAVLHAIATLIRKFFQGPAESEAANKLGIQKVFIFSVILHIRLL
jgi:hypothetical protein